MSVNNKASGLIEAIQSAGEADLQQLDGRIAQLGCELDALKQARKIVAARLGAGAVRGDVGGGGGKSDDEWRQEIYDVIDGAEGPLKPGVIGQRVGLSSQRVGALCRHEWFKKSPEGLANA